MQKELDPVAAWWIPPEGGISALLRRADRDPRCRDLARAHPRTICTEMQPDSCARAAGPACRAKWLDPEARGHHPWPEPEPLHRDGLVDLDGPSAGQYRAARCLRRRITQRAGRHDRVTARARRAAVGDTARTDRRGAAERVPHVGNRVAECGEPCPPRPASPAPAPVASRPSDRRCRRIRTSPSDYSLRLAGHRLRPEYGPDIESDGRDSRRSTDLPGDLEPHCGPAADPGQGPARRRPARHRLPGD